ncbi:Uncharacterised protein [Streptococcus pneumoniae]|nr:Uncharacterised protein [Streptococcus pneumoniae]VNI73624.1 Uncharacterised protein [Streptococcus pneumoniae]VNU58241.1 Uncharacterised protein [Streptococcus pneumoniae]VTB93967.1 Uncharacterised protein [Streptococcus pneumoniae]
MVFRLGVNNWGFKNNILTEKMIFNLSAHLIVFENIKQYF